MGNPATSSSFLDISCIVDQSAAVLCELDGQVCVAEREYIDKRDTGGNLWVISGRKIVTTISEFQKRGAHFKYREGGGKAIKGRSACNVATIVI